MRISSTNAIEGGRVLYTIGRIEAASTWHPAHGSPLQENWRELVLRELIRKAEDIDADAIIRVDYQNDGVIRIDETGVNLKRVVAKRRLIQASQRVDDQYMASWFQYAPVSKQAPKKVRLLSRSEIAKT